MKKYTVLLFIGLTILACEDFLEEEPLDSVAPEAFFQTEVQVDIALNGMYHRFINENWYRRAIWNFTILGTDIGRFRATTNVIFASYDTYTVDPSNRWIEGFMGQAYVTLNAANTVINRVQGSSLSEELKTRAIAEAKFIRARTYFDMVRVYGGVNIKTDETISPQVDPSDFPRHTAAEVYDQIILDLTDAKAGLGLEPRTVGTPTFWVAQALLGKVMMQRAGTLNESNADQLWADAASELDNVINNGPFELLPNFADIFDLANEGSIEHVFSIKFSRELSGGHMGFRFMGPRGRDVVPGNGFHTILVDTNFYANYTPADTRRLATARQDTTINGEFIEYRDGLAVNKYLDPAPRDGHRGDNDHIYMRLADVLLLAAEAHNEVSGPNATAYGYINQVRNRAGLPDLTTGLDQATFRDALLAERALELAFESHRKFDLVRMDKLVEVMAAKGINITRDDYVQPIPQSFLDELGWENNP